ncbi:MAG: thiopeptide-type bacteriocin biosynthesis protein [Dysgonamonadaceae bacterium]|nr:thiopeptide-type bacteriocin biosynthesis protein [Dysgonamonadaceae bacterium]
MKPIQRTYMPGSTWIYIKLYVGIKTADDLLIKVIAPIIRELQRKQAIEKWFFIRYSDPDFHLRIRLLVTDFIYIGEIICLFQKKLVYWNKNNLLWKMQLDSYNRELERYGKNLIEEAESVFYADSECVLSIIRKLGNNEKYRWMIALKLIDSLLSDFHLSMEEKQKLMENLSKLFKTEFGFNEYNAKSFNTKFRENKMIVESTLNNIIDEKEFNFLYSPIRKRTKQLVSIVGKINKNKLKHINLNELLSSYLHMMLNRLFRSKNRIHELILYDFMRRYYAGEMAKLKYNK